MPVRLPKSFGGKQPSKYRAKPTHLDGVRFDSKKEAQFYGLLQMREKAGEVRNVRRQPWFVLVAPVVVGGLEDINAGRIAGMSVVGRYEADFQYEELQPNGTWVQIVVDVKSSATRTTTYRLKKRMVEATYGITVHEV